MEKTVKEKILKKYFKDEYGNWLPGHPDELAVDLWLVREEFPEVDQCFRYVSEVRSGNGYVLPDGIWLMPDKILEVKTE